MTVLVVAPPFKRWGNVHTWAQVAGGSCSATTLTGTQCAQARLHWSHRSERFLCTVCQIVGHWFRLDNKKLGFRRIWPTMQIQSWIDVRVVSIGRAKTRNPKYANEMNHPTLASHCVPKFPKKKSYELPFSLPLPYSPSCLIRVWGPFLHGV